MLPLRPSLAFPAPYLPAQTPDTTSTSVFDGRVIDVCATGQEHTSKGVPVFVVVVRLDWDLFACGSAGRRLVVAADQRLQQKCS